MTDRCLHHTFGRPSVYDVVVTQLSQTTQSLSHHHQPLTETSLALCRPPVMTILRPSHLNTPQVIQLLIQAVTVLLVESGVSFYIPKDETTVQT